MNPGPYPRFIDKTYTRVIDFDTPATHMTRVRLQGEQPPRGGGNQPLRGEATQNQTVIGNANTPWAQQLDIWMTPHGFLKAAAGNHVIEFHHQQGTGHHPGMLLAYLPKQRILFEADGYNANVPANNPTPNPVGPYTINLLENIRRLKLDIQRIISVHMPPDDRVVTMQELLRAAGQPGASLTSN